MKRSLLLLLVSILVPALVVTPARGQFANPDGGDLERGTFPTKWTTGGPKCMEIPEWQVHEYNPNFFILRQSGCTDAEMPFLYLIFGTERGVLWDTGSRNGNLAPELRRCSRSGASRSCHAHPVRCARRGCGQQLLRD